MGKGGDSNAKTKGPKVQEYSTLDVQKHSNWRAKDSWIVYKGRVYDVSNFISKHPGGNVIVMYSGQDATTAMDMFHPDKEKIEKWLKPYYRGDCPELAKPDPITADFNKLTEDLRNEGYFDSSKLFYLGMFGHIVLLEVLATWFVWSGGLEWGGYAGYWGLAFVLAIAQAQAGWLQHDLGHLAVFKSYDMNYYGHQLTISHMKAASRWWWTSRHNRHHAKPNVIRLDPDIQAPMPLFVFDEKWFGKGRYYFRALVPFQKYVWFLLGPPVVTTFLFVYMNARYVIEGARFGDMLWMASYFIRFSYQFGYHLDTWGLIKLYYATRIIETQWFTWVTSMNHLPMPFLDDSNIDWITLQVSTTQNVEPGWFNDWFTGHLNYQIEHHLWPTMPRHNYYKASFRIKELCKKHGLEYRVHGIYQCCVDICDKLQLVSNQHAEYVQKKSAKKLS
jgi:fatty acid desaturase 2 (delta-6 desaturase)